MAFYRKPSPLEITYIAQDTPTRSPFVNQYFVEGEGDLTLDQLQSAVTKAAKLLAESHLILRGYWGFRYWDDSGQPPKVMAGDASHWDGRSPHGFETFETPMDVRKGPLVEVLLLEGYPRRVLFRTHHAVMDGAGTILLMQLVFRALRGDPLEGSNSRATEWDVALQEGPVVKLVTTGACKPVIVGKNATPAVGTLWKRYLYPYRPSGIGGKVMAVVASWADEQNIEKIIFRVPADLRRYLKKGTVTASNCTSMLDIDPGNVRSPQKLQQLIIGAMRNKQDVAWINPVNRWLRWLPTTMLASKQNVIKAIHQRGLYGFSCMTTNMGQFDFSAFSCAQFRCKALFGIPIPMDIVPLYITFYQTSEGTGFVLCMPRALAEEADLDRLFQRICDGLDVMELSKAKPAT